MALPRPDEQCITLIGVGRGKATAPTGEPTSERQNLVEAPFRVKVPLRRPFVACYARALAADLTAPATTIIGEVRE